ncbi:murein hydrolase activator EnvC family protein [Microbacterium radiodurans]|nr:M23 family metallopeptidase [Microbacterium radiodurans]
MTRPRTRIRLTRRHSALLLMGLLSLLGLAGGSAPAAVASPASLAAVSPAESGRPGWRLPIPDAAIQRGFEAPAHEYAPGHRGVDLEAGDSVLVSAPAAGTVVFAGPVAGRGVVTIDHGDGAVSTLEPVTATVVAGDRIAGGAVIGRVSVGGHTPPGGLHWGVRQDGDYVNPLVLLGAIPRAVLLPCC